MKNNDKHEKNRDKDQEHLMLYKLLHLFKLTGG